MHPEFKDCPIPVATSPERARRNLAEYQRLQEVRRPEHKGAAAPNSAALAELERLRRKYATPDQSFAEPFTEHGGAR